MYMVLFLALSRIKPSAASKGENVLEEHPQLSCRRGYGLGVWQYFSLIAKDSDL